VNQHLKNVGRLFLLTGIAATVWFMIQNGDTTSVTWYIIALPFLFWTITPYALVYIIGRNTENFLRNEIIIFITSFTITAGGIWMLYDAFVQHLDPQSGLVFLFLPVLQLIFVGVSFALIQILNRIVSNR
jgi:hypothetical protein